MPNNNISRLKQQLQVTGLAQKNNSLFQILNSLITELQTVSDEVANIEIDIPPAAGPDETFLTATDESADLPNSRELLEGTGISFDDSVANERTVDVTIPDVSAAEVLTSDDETAIFPNSRELLAGVGVSFNDAVANQRTISIASGSGFLTGTGSPHGVVTGGIGNVYVDTNTGYIYEKVGGNGTAYGWYLTRPLSGGGLEGPTPMVMIPSGAGAITSAMRVNGFGYFMPSVADAIDTLSPTSVTTNSALYSNGVYYKTIATAATINTVMYMNTGGVSVNTRQVLDTDFDLWISMRTGADITSSRWYFGITASVPTNSDNFGTGSSGAIMFQYSTARGDGGWIGQTCINGAANHTESATVNTIAANTNYKLRIRFVRTGTPTVYFSVNDGTEVSQTTNIPPSGSQYFMFFGVTTLANAAKTFGVKGIGGWHGPQ